MTAETVSDANAAASEPRRTAELNEHTDKTGTVEGDTTDETTQMTLPTTGIIEKTDGYVETRTGQKDDMTPCDNDATTVSDKSVSTDSYTVIETQKPTGGGIDLLMENAASDGSDASKERSQTDTAEADRGQQTCRVTRSHAQRSKPPDGAAETDNGDIVTRRAVTDQVPVLPPGERSETTDLQRSVNSADSLRLI